jgi:hypothetical protein
MGIRQSLGLFLTPVTQDLALTATDFTLAVAVQNIVWGLSQAPVGAIRGSLRPACHDELRAPRFISLALPSWAQPKTRLR